MYLGRGMLEHRNKYLPTSSAEHICRYVTDGLKCFAHRCSVFNDD